jgi:hypothetical protein
MLKESQLREVDEIIREFCRREPPPNVRAKLEYAVRIDGNAATLVELRPAFRADIGRTESPVARFRFTAATATWRLFWRDRKGRWHRYPRARPVKRLATLFAEVRRDSTRIFWG